MKAIKVHEYGAPEVMRLEDAPELRPGPGQVLVDIRAVGVNPVDAYMRSGAFYKKELPFTPGSDAAGVVEAVGEGVTGFAPGDSVYTAGTLTGAYAEKALCKESQAHLLPAELSFTQGACVGVPYAAAYRAVFHKARALPGESILVHGATGGVGIAAVQLSRAAGLKVIATGGTEEGRELALKEGAHVALDHTAAEHMEKAQKLSGRGVDVIIEFLANVNLGHDLKIMAKGGRIVVVGCRGTVEIDPRDAMGKDIGVLGMSLFNATERELSEIHSALAAGFENRSLRPVVGHKLALGEAARAHHLIMEKSARGKIVLVP